MKKNLAMIMILLMLFVTGCGKDEEKLMEEYGSDYYNKYMSSINYDSYVITIEMLERANKEGNSNYDLTDLERCNKESSVTFDVNSNGNIEKTTYNLKCN